MTPARMGGAHGWWPYDKTRSFRASPMVSQRTGPDSLMNADETLSPTRGTSDSRMAMPPQ